MSDVLTRLRDRNGFSPAERVLDCHPDRRISAVNHLIREAANEIERLTAERDETRRWFCYEFEDARAEAQRRGWRCFTDAQPTSVACESDHLPDARRKVRILAVKETATTQPHETP